MGHISVLYNEVLTGLRLCTGQTIVDGTLGGAGHSLGIIEKIMPQGVLIGIDKDTQAIDRCSKLLPNNTILVHDDFKNILEVLKGLNITEIDGALLDLGVSSFQLDDKDRGFSYMQDAPLDMRMNNTRGFTAKDVVNTYSKENLVKIIREYGEENWAARIGEFICTQRQNKEINTTFELVEIIKKAIPKNARKEGPHPAKRTFQAIRIEVNGELKALEKAMYDYVSVLKKGGRLAVITFHSLEDRCVKQAFKKLFNPCECPKELPMCVCGKTRQIEIITRKPILPTVTEIEENPRSRSAKLRIAEKI